MRKILLFLGSLICTFDVTAKDDITYINKISDEVKKMK